MADTMKLLNPSDANYVTFSPLSNYTFPEERKRSLNYTLDGTLYIYEWSAMNRYELRVNNINVLDANRINGWWEDRTLLYLYYDLINYPLLYKLIKIVNSTRPLQYMAPFVDEIYEGSMILREVDS